MMVVVPLVGSPPLQLVPSSQFVDVAPVQLCACARDSGKATIQPATKTAIMVAGEATLRLTHLSLAAENTSEHQGARRKPRPAAMLCHALSAPVAKRMARATNARRPPKSCFIPIPDGPHGWCANATRLGSRFPGLTLHGFTPERLTPAELAQALNWTGPNCSSISGRSLLLRNSSRGGVAVDGAG
jgi:hypothetical protein